MRPKGNFDHTYEFIRQFIQANGYAPSRREIMAGVGLATPSAVTHHLERLAAAGKLAWTPRAARSIRILKSKGQRR